MMLKKEYFSKMLIIFGVATLVTWVANFISLIIPFQFKVAKWVYLLSQEISEKSIFPLLGILAIIGGVYICNFAKESKCKCAVWAERLSAVFCIFLFTGLITMAVVYSLSIKSLHNDIKNQIMGEANKVKSQVAMMVQSNPGIKQENIQSGMQELDKRVNLELKKAKKDIIINSIKILLGLISYALVSLMFTIYLFKVSGVKNNYATPDTEK